MLPFNQITQHIKRLNSFVEPISNLTILTIPSSPKMSTGPSTTTPASNHEPHPDPIALTATPENPKEISYTPNPTLSIPLSPSRQKIVTSITSLYSGSCVEGGTGEQDMHVYSEKAIYDDPWSYCDTRFKIAGQWYGELFPE